jgi:hypothetical protein
MMKYMFLIYIDEIAGSKISKEDMDGYMQEMYDYSDSMNQAGVQHITEALHPTSTSTTVRVREGKKVTTHGPFAETKEQLGGFYLIEAANLDEAIEWAARCPAAQWGTIEVRPVVDLTR